MLTTRPTLLYPPTALAAAAPASTALRAPNPPTAQPSAGPDSGFAALLQRQAGQRALALGGRGERPPLAVAQTDRQVDRPAERLADAPRPARAAAPPQPGAAPARSAANAARPAPPATSTPETPAHRASPAQARRTALGQTLNNSLTRARSASAASPAAGLAARRAPGGAGSADSSLSATQRHPKSDAPADIRADIPTANPAANPAATPTTDNALPTPLPTPTGCLPQAAAPPATPGSGAPALGSGPRNAVMAAADGSPRPVAAPDARRAPPGAWAAPLAGAAAATQPMRDSATGLLGSAPGAMRTQADTGPRSSTAPGTSGAALPTAPAPDRLAGAPGPPLGLPAGGTAATADGLPATAADAASNPALPTVHAPQDASPDAPTDAPHSAPKNATALALAGAPAEASPAAGAVPFAATQPAGANPPPWRGRDRPPSGVGHGKAGTAHEGLEPVPLTGWAPAASTSTAPPDAERAPATRPEPASGSRSPPSADLAARQTAPDADRTGAPQPATAQGPAGWDALAALATLALPSAPAPALAGASGPPPVPVDARIDVPLHSPVFAPALGAQISLFAQDGVQTARLLLNPPEMGPVAVQIVIDGNAARVDFQADRAATRDVIEASLPALASALQDAGLTLAGGGVSQQPPRQPPPAPPAPPAPALAPISQNPAERASGVAQAGRPLRSRGVVDLVA